jgi:hypothetical protein
MPRKQPHEFVKLQVRLPEVLRARLAAEAEAAERSLNSEILFRLGQTLTDEWQEFIASQVQREADEQAFIERRLQDPKVRETLARLLRDAPRKKGKGDA